MCLSSIKQCIYGIRFLYPPMAVITKTLLEGDNTMSYGRAISSHVISQWASKTAAARGWEVEKVPVRDDVSGTRTDS